MRNVIALSLSLAACSFASVASAEPNLVVIGSYDAQSKQVTVFESLLSKRFADGGQVTKIYGGYNPTSRKFHLVRAGKSLAGTCQTEVFQLVPTSGQRLALADGLTGQAWNPNILQKMGISFGCEARDCFSCDPDHGIPEFGEQPGCTCGDDRPEVGDETDFDVENQGLGVCVPRPPGYESYSYRQLMAPGTQVGSEG